MGTRSLTFVYDDTTPVVNMYRQFDGYPSGHGKELHEFLKPIRMVNGFGMRGEKNVANGAGCLAAQMVAHFKKEPGYFYLFPTSENDLGQDYEYHVFVEPDASIRVKVVEIENPIFDGGLEAFGKFVEDSL